MNHPVTTSNSLRGVPNSSVDILNRQGEITKRRWFDHNGNQVRDVHFDNHGNPRTHPGWPHVHGSLTR